MAAKKAEKSRSRAGTGARKRAQTPRIKQSAKARRRPLLTAFKWLLLGGLVIGALGAAAAAGILWHFGNDPDLPEIRSVGDYAPKQVTRIAARDGTSIGELYVERRSYAPFEAMPELLINAFIAAEDADFFRHSGLDYWGMARAAFINLKSGETKQGASTITQQVVKTFLLSPERTYKRKLQEIILARRLEQALSKEDILTLYLNQIYFGHGRYGVVEASKYYFGKQLSELHAGETAMLAGLVQAPENISPKKLANRERAKRRQQYVLEQMVRRGFLDRDEAKKWIDEPIRIIKDPFPDLGVAPEWIGVARKHLVTQYGEERIPTLGGRVVTTLDLKIQNAALRALRQGLRGHDKRRKYHRPVRHIKPDKIGLEVAKLARRLPKGGPKPGEGYLAVVRSVHSADGELVVDLGDYRAAVMVGDGPDPRYNPDDKPLGKRFAIGDVVRVRVPSRRDPERQPKHAGEVVELARGPEGAVVVIDPNTREVLALVGGFDIDVADFDRATQAKRQPGSTFKPFVYAAALATGRYTAASIVNDAPEVYNLWKPQNYKKGAFEGPVRLRHALAKSINTVSIRVLSDIGPEAVVELARKLGIESELPAQLSLALGSGEVTPIELTNAFASLAAGGIPAEPRFIRQIDDVRTPIELPPPPPAEPALSPQAAYVITDMMTSVVNQGTASAASKLDMPIAGKTGTSNDARDAWFIGMTPNYAVGVWVGFDDNRPLGRGESGGKTALPVYIDLMEQIGQREKSARWEMPNGVTQVRVDTATGLLAPDSAPIDTAYTEVFVAGSEPTEYALAPDEMAASSFVQDEYDDAYGDNGDDGYGGDDYGDDEYDQDSDDSGDRAAPSPTP